MLNTYYYLIGFLIYTLFCMITFKVYSRTKDETEKKIGLIVVYVCYSLLAIYVINFSDRGASGFEIILQSLIYVITEGFFLWFYYNDVLIKNQEYNYG